MLREKNPHIVSISYRIEKKLIATQWSRLKKAKTTLTNWYSATYSLDQTNFYRCLAPATSTTACRFLCHHKMFFSWQTLTPGRKSNVIIRPLPQTQCTTYTSFGTDISLPPQCLQASLSHPLLWHKENVAVAPKRQGTNAFIIFWWRVWDFLSF